MYKVKSLVSMFEDHSHEDRPLPKKVFFKPGASIEKYVHKTNLEDDLSREISEMIKRTLFKNNLQPMCDGSQPSKDENSTLASPNGLTEGLQSPAKLYSLVAYDSRIRDSLLLVNILPSQFPLPPASREPVGNQSVSVRVHLPVKSPLCGSNKSFDCDTFAASLDEYTPTSQKIIPVQLNEAVDNDESKEIKTTNLKLEDKAEASNYGKSNKASENTILEFLPLASTYRDSHILPASKRNTHNGTDKSRRLASQPTTPQAAHHFNDRHSVETGDLTSSTSPDEDIFEHSFAYARTPTTPYESVSKARPAVLEDIPEARHKAYLELQNYTIRAILNVGSADCAASMEPRRKDATFHNRNYQPQGGQVIIHNVEDTLGNFGDTKVKVGLLRRLLRKNKVRSTIEEDGRRGRLLVDPIEFSTTSTNRMRGSYVVSGSLSKYKKIDKDMIGKPELISTTNNNFIPTRLSPSPILPRSSPHPMLSEFQLDDSEILAMITVLPSRKESDSSRARELRPTSGEDSDESLIYKDKPHPYRSIVLGLTESYTYANLSDVRNDPEVPKGSAMLRAAAEMRLKTFDSHQVNLRGQRNQNLNETARPTKKRNVDENQVEDSYKRLTGEDGFPLEPLSKPVKRDGEATKNASQPGAQILKPALEVLSDKKPITPNVKQAAPGAPGAPITPQTKQVAPSAPITPNTKQVAPSAPITPNTKQVAPSAPIIEQSSTVPEIRKQDLTRKSETFLHRLSWSNKRKSGTKGIVKSKRFNFHRNSVVPGMHEKGGLVNGGGELNERGELNEKREMNERGELIEKLNERGELDEKREMNERGELIEKGGLVNERGETVNEVLLNQKSLELSLGTEKPSAPSLLACQDSATTASQANRANQNKLNKPTMPKSRSNDSLELFSEFECFINNSFD